MLHISNVDFLQKNKRIALASLLLCLVLTSTAQTQTVEVMEFHPAPGQFVNVMPEATEGMTQADICQKATEQLEKGLLLHLGTFGGYVTVRFDHPIENKRGSDLRITGNAFYATNDPVYGKTTIGGSIEPGIVYVGVGDDVETATWYELAGSEYYTTEIHDFEVTYHKPTAETGTHSMKYYTLDNYIQWEATWTENGVRKDSTGYHPKNIYHKQTYWPMWEDGETLTFRGGCVPNNAVDYSGDGTNWVQYRYSADAYGYVDAAPKDDNASTFDLDWAVDADGNHVDLDHADFIRVQTAIFQYCGWVGETSTEVAAFTDLHLVEGYDNDPIIITPKTNAIRPIITTPEGTNTYYNVMGQKVDKLVRGHLYIHQGRKIIY